MLLQVSPLRSLLASPDSDGPCAAAPLFLRRAHSAAGLAIASSSSSSTSDEGAAAVPPENGGKAKASGASGKRSLGKAKKVGGEVGGKGASSSGKGLDVVLQSLDVMTKKLLGLEKEVKVLKENVILRTPLRTEKRDGIAFGRQGSCLSSMFSVKDGVGRKRLTERKRPALGDGGGVEVKPSAEAVAIMERFREDGYLKGVDLWQDGKVVPERLQDLRIRNSLKSASDKFGVEHQEIAK